MAKFFGLLFSPSGCVGRAEFWLWEIVIVLAELALCAFAVLGILQILIPLEPSFAHWQTLHFHRPSDTEKQHMLTAIQAVQVKLYVLGALALIGIWCSFAIEIKRWHDRGMSGGLSLLRFIPIGFLAFALEQKYLRHELNPNATLIFWGVSGVIFLFQLVQLGFLPSIDAAPAKTPLASKRNYGPSATRGPVGPAKPGNQSSSSFGTFVFGFICAVLLVGAVGAAYVFEYGNLPGFLPVPGNSTNSVANVPPPPSQPATNAPATVAAAAPTPAATPTPAPVLALPGASSASPAPRGGDDNVLTRESSGPDSITAMSGRDWVIANGERLSGITQVTAAPGMQVTIVSSSGEKKVSAASLPQEFRDLWNITPATLAAANQPATNQP